MLETDRYGVTEDLVIVWVAPCSVPGIGVSKTQTSTCQDTDIHAVDDGESVIVKHILFFCITQATDLSTGRLTVSLLLSKPAESSGPLPFPHLA